MNEEKATSFKPKKSVALSGVTAGNTALCTVGKTGNDLHYRGYDILDVANACEFEEIAYLLSEQELPPDLNADIADAYVAAGGDPWAFARLPVWLPLVTLDAALWWADYYLAQGDDPAHQSDVAMRLARARAYLIG